MLRTEHPASVRGRRWCSLPVVVALVAAVGGCGASPGAGGLPPTPAVVPASAGTLTRGDVDAWLDGLVPAALNGYGMAGAAVSVVHDGTVLTTRGYGQADTGTGDTPARAVDPRQTLFRVGSISKTFTATAVMQLVEQGKLDLDADVNSYLDFTLPEPRGRVTVRHLLTHTAGFEERARPGIEPPGTHLDLHDFVANDPPEQIFTPGTVPAYSNYGNSLAGYVVQRVSGQPFAAYVREHVLERTGMTSSGFEQPLALGLRARLSRAYPDSSQPPAPFEMVAASPAGALSTTAADMGRYMLAQLGQLPPARSLLRPQTLAQMHAPALGADQLGVFARGPRMTLGFFDESRHGHPVLGHDGDTTVFHSAMELYPDDATGIFVTLNSTGRQPADSVELREAVLTGFSDRYFPGAAANPAPQPTAAAHAAQAAGAYESSRSLHSTFLSVLRLSGQTSVAARPDGTVVITPGPGSFRPAAYREVAPWVWQEVGGSHVITMRTSGDRVDAIGYDSAFTLLRTDPAHTGGLAIAVLGTSLLVLILAAVGWPFGVLLRRRYHAPAPIRVGPRWVRLGTRIGVGAVLCATLAWIPVLMSVFAYRDVPDLVLRPIQLGQLVGVLGVVPAAAHAVTLVRAHARWTRVVAGLLVLLALVGVAWFALTFHLVGLSTSY